VTLRVVRRVARRKRTPGGAREWTAVLTTRLGQPRAHRRRVRLEARGDQTARAAGGRSGISGVGPDGTRTLGCGGAARSSSDGTGTLGTASRDVAACVHAHGWKLGAERSPRPGPPAGAAARTSAPVAARAPTAEALAAAALKEAPAVATDGSTSGGGAAPAASSGSPHSKANTPMMSTATTRRSRQRREPRDIRSARAGASTVDCKRGAALVRYVSECSHDQQT